MEWPVNYRQWEDDLDAAENFGRKGIPLWPIGLVAVLAYLVWRNR